MTRCLDSFEPLHARIPEEIRISNLFRFRTSIRYSVFKEPPTHSASTSKSPFCQGLSRRFAEPRDVRKGYTRLAGRRQTFFCTFFKFIGPQGFQGIFFWSEPADPDPSGGNFQKNRPPAPKKVPFGAKKSALMMELRRLMGGVAPSSI